MEDAVDEVVGVQYSADWDHDEPSWEPEGAGHISNPNPEFHIFLEIIRERWDVFISICGQQWLRLLALPLPHHVRVVQVFTLVDAGSEQGVDAELAFGHSDPDLGWFELAALGVVSAQLITSILISEWIVIALPEVSIDIIRNRVDLDLLGFAVYDSALFQGDLGGHLVEVVLLEDVRSDRKLGICVPVQVLSSVNFWFNGPVDLDVVVVVLAVEVDFDVQGLVDPDVFILIVDDLELGVEWNPDESDRAVGQLGAVTLDEVTG